VHRVGRDVRPPIAYDVAAPTDATVCGLTGSSFKPTWVASAMAAFVAQIAAPVRRELVPSVSTERWTMLPPVHKFVEKTQPLVSLAYSGSKSVPVVTPMPSTGADPLLRVTKVHAAVNVQWQLT
jgi:hypothetical protein